MQLGRDFIRTWGDLRTHMMRIGETMDLAGKAEAGPDGRITLLTVDDLDGRCSVNERNFALLFVGLLVD